MEKENSILKNIKKILVDKLFCSLCLIGVCFVFILFSNDSGNIRVLLWLLSIIIVSFLFRPILNTNKLHFFDNGFSLSLGIGIAISFLSTWFLSATLHIEYNTISCIAITLLEGIIISFLSKKKFIEYRWSIKKLEDFIVGMSIFVLLFTIAFWIKGFNPDVYSTEKFMDFGIMQSIYRQKTAIPLDFWFSNTKLNYYYLGQSCAVFLCNISFNTPEYGYNLMLCTLFTTLFLSSFELVYAILHAYKIDNKHKIIGGIFGAISTTLIGNGHWIIYGIIIPVIEKANNVVFQEKYWFPNSTRFIGYNPNVADKTIHEFPSYSFILGDLHAHVCNTLFTIPLLALLFNYVEEKKTRMHYPKTKKEYVKEFLSPTIVLLGVLTGLYRGTNYWDFPIYFIVSGAIILFTDCKRWGIRVKTILFVLLKGFNILLIGTIVIFPFSSSFVKMSSQLGLCKNHTPLWQFLILWAIPLFIGICFIVFLVKTNKSTTLVKKCEKCSKQVICFDKKTTPTFSFIDISIIAFIFCTIGLIISPEIIYVKDIYGDEYARSNTMFKFTYQAFILFGICIGIAIGKLLSYVDKEKLCNYHKYPYRKFGLGLCTIVIILSLYSIWSTYAWFGNVFDAKLRKEISATEYLFTTPDFYKDAPAIAYINNFEKNKVVNIVESSGLSYTSNCKLSVFTGTNTVIGWYTHEWLWKDNVTIVDNRFEEVRLFYESGDKIYCQDFIEKYNIDYIYVGSTELQKYNINENGFRDLGHLVWESVDKTMCLLYINN